MLRVLRVDGCSAPSTRSKMGSSAATATAGASLRELMARMGHASTRAALVYLHDTDDRQRAIATVISDLARPGLAHPNAPSEGSPENAAGT